MKKSLLFEGLTGPYSKEAVSILRLASTFTPAQALALSDAWELDNHPDYLSYCSMVAKALEKEGRALPLGWFEAVLADCTWLESTKALHAIADAVMGTLAKDLVPSPISQALIKPWLLVTSGDVEGPRFLLNEVICTP